ncbi:MAG: hypothetical protein JNK77_10860, partial [Saprospiraceae bacterium]|nr:hypothetical protein [Saprospiraceae bacterium]
KRDDVAIVRVEQLYPLPEKQIKQILNKYKNAKVCWVQEEPRNMGAWQYLLVNLAEAAGFTPVTRKASASPATGFKKVHDQQQHDIVDAAFG